MTQAAYADLETYTYGGLETNDITYAFLEILPTPCGAWGPFSGTTYPSSPDIWHDLVYLEIPTGITNIDFTHYITSATMSPDIILRTSVGLEYPGGPWTVDTYLNHTGSEHWQVSEDAPGSGTWFSGLPPPRQMMLQIAPRTTPVGRQIDWKWDGIFTCAGMPVKSRLVAILG